MTKKKSKKWILIVVIVAVVILLGVPAAAVIYLQNSSYDCSFQYSKVEDMLKEVARKNVYYDAAAKTVEVGLDQDLINSILKDNFDKLGFEIPKNIEIKEMLFCTRDQRLYVNAKSGWLNTPVSFKIKISSSAEGITIAATDMKLGGINAPGFVQNLFPADSLKYSIGYSDYDIPQVFSIKDIKFGTGYVKASIELEPDKVADAAMEYRKTLMDEIDKYKNSQPGIMNNFLNKLLGTDVLSESKVKEYVKSVLNDGEVVNSAIFFATADDPGKYSKTFTDVQKKVSDWAAPLQSLQSISSIDGAVNTILNDQKLRELLGWFLTPDEIAKYEGTVNDYYGMYKEYYNLYEDALASIDKAVGGIKTKDINDFADNILDYTAQAGDARNYALDQLKLIDAKSLDQVIAYLEKDKGVAGNYLRKMDADQYKVLKDTLVGLDTTKAETEKMLKNADMQAVKEFEKVVDSRRKFAVSLITALKRKQYETAFNRLSGDGVIDKGTSRFYNKYIKTIDWNDLQKLAP